MQQTEGPNLVNKRLAKTGQKPADLARALGVSRATVHDWLHQIKRPRDKFRRLIRTWSEGDVPENAWETAAERDQESALRKSLAAPVAA